MYPSPRLGAVLLRITQGAPGELRRKKPQWRLAKSAQALCKVEIQSKALQDLHNSTVDLQSKDSLSVCAKQTRSQRGIRLCPTDRGAICGGHFWCTCKATYPFPALRKSTIVPLLW